MFTDRITFLKLAVSFECGLIIVAAILGWIFGVNPVTKLVWSGPAALWGMLAALPMLGLFVLSQRYPVGPLKAIKEFLIEALGPPLVACRWYDLLLVAAAAGLGEELLFRGVLHERFGLAISNVLFGLAHLITPLYAVAAGVIGLYLGWLFDRTGNLLAPIIAHGLYDFLAFLILARTCRKLGPPPLDDASIE